MSTRAIYTFIDMRCEHNVYKHCDGYPSGAAIAFANALPYAWPLPRFEADEFSCAFIAGNKDSDASSRRSYLEDAEQAADPEDAKAFRDIAEKYAPGGNYAGMSGGNLRTMDTGPWKEVAPGDIQYRYEIRCVDGELEILCYSVSCSYDTGKWSEKLEFAGRLETFTNWAQKEAA